MPHPAWVRELRAPFLLLPVIFVPVGLAIAWSHGHFNLLYAVLTVAGVVSLHASVNVLNDYFDFRSGIDLATTPTPFSGGSTILPSKLMAPNSVLGMGVLFLGVGIAIGSYFVYSFAFDPFLIAIVAVAALSVVSYSSVTSKLGIGELELAGRRIGGRAEVDLAAIGREAQVWAHLGVHSNLVTIYNANVYGDHVVIASEYLSGGTLEDRMKSRGGAPEPLTTAISIAILSTCASPTKQPASDRPLPLRAI